MQLSLHADYACRVLIYLATASTKRSSVEEIATSFNISQNHLVKVVHQLGRFGFITTTRGRGGGISLSRAPEEIKIGDVIRQMEPGFALVECFDPTTNSCPISAACGLKPWLAKAMNAFLQTLEEVSLADICMQRRKLGSSLGLN